MRQVRPYIGAAVGSSLFLFSVLGAIDCVCVLTGRTGLLAGQWQRYPSWCVAALMIFIWVAGRYIAVRDRRVSTRAAAAVIARARMK